MSLGFMTGLCVGSAITALIVGHEVSAMFLALGALMSLYADN